MSDVRHRIADPAQQRKFAAIVMALAGLLMSLSTLLNWLRLTPIGAAAKRGVPEARLSPWPGTLPDGEPYGGMNPALWTAVLGVVLVACGLLFFVTDGRVARYVAALSVVTAGIGFVALCFFLSNPQAAFDLGEVPEMLLSVEWGGWVAWTAALFGAVSALAVIVPVRAVDGGVDRN